MQTANKVLFLNEWYGNWRLIWTDGRELPKDPEPRWNGYSVGRWVDDYTFVVETVGLNPRTWLDHAGLRFHDLRHTAATKLLEQGTPYAVVAHILGWSASTAVRMAKRYGHIRPEVRRQALEAITTAEIQPSVNQIVYQVRTAIESKQLN